MLRKRIEILFISSVSFLQNSSNITANLYCEYSCVCMYTILFFFHFIRIGYGLNSIWNESDKAVATAFQIVLNVRILGS